MLFTTRAVRYHKSIREYKGIHHALAKDAVSHYLLSI